MKMVTPDCFKCDGEGTVEGWSKSKPKRWCTKDCDRCGGLGKEKPCMSFTIYEILARNQFKQRLWDDPTLIVGE